MEERQETAGLFSVQPAFLEHVKFSFTGAPLHREHCWGGWGVEAVGRGRGGGVS